MVFLWLLLVCLFTGCNSQNSAVHSETKMVQNTTIEDTQPSDSDSETPLNTAGATDENEQIPISIEIGDVTLSGELDDSDLAQEFASLLPQTISMQRVGGGREFYGGIDGSLTYDEADAQTTFENGDIAYWFSGNGLCLLYDNQVEEPEVKSGIIVIGKITSDFSELHNMAVRKARLLQITDHVGRYSKDSSNFIYLKFSCFQKLCFIWGDRDWRVFHAFL